MQNRRLKGGPRYDWMDGVKIGLIDRGIRSKGACKEFEGGKNNCLWMIQALPEIASPVVKPDNRGRREEVQRLYTAGLNYTMKTVGICCDIGDGCHPSVTNLLFIMMDLSFPKSQLVAVILQ